MAEYSLTSLIYQCLEEMEEFSEFSNEDNEDLETFDKRIDNAPREINRKFNIFLSSIGYVADFLKTKNNQYAFSEEKVPYVKALIKSMLSSNDIMNFVKKNKNESDVIKYEKFHEYVQLLIDQLDHCGDFTYEQIQAFIIDISNVYNAFPLTLIDSCHRLLDSIKPTLSSVLISQQFDITYNLFLMLKREVANRIVLNALSTKEIAELLEIAKECLPAKDVLEYNYNDFIPAELRYEYVQRDSNILAEIQNDPLLREYIEKSLGKKAENIFGYQDTSTGGNEKV